MLPASCILRARDNKSSGGYIVFSHGKNIMVRNMAIDGNCSHAVRFYGCRDVSVKGCSILNNYATHARRDAGHLNPCSSATTASMLPKGILTRMMTAKL